ncbi:MAG: hypothetical protein JXR63_04430, partial [Spirochaetales bacterium]|nr:hypothetical protein [Spirochaetales bacterium]
RWMREDKIFSEVIEIMRVFALDDEKYYEYLRKLDFQLEMKYIEKSGYDQGLEEGKLEGMQEGRLEGILEGKLEGKKEGKLDAKIEILYKILVKRFDYEESDLSGILKDSENFSIDELLDFAVDANSFEEFLLKIK